MKKYRKLLEVHKDVHEEENPEIKALLSQAWVSRIVQLWFILTLSWLTVRMPEPVSSSSSRL